MEQDLEREKLHNRQKTGGRSVLVTLRSKNLVLRRIVQLMELGAPGADGGTVLKHVVMGQDPGAELVQCHCLKMVAMTVLGQTWRQRIVK